MRPKAYPLLLGAGNRPAVDWNFAGGVMPSALTFSRSSLATMYDAAGTLVTASSGSPRLTYDPVTHAALGLLVEEQRTNLLTYSEALDNAAWAKNGGASITANVATAPDGYLTADRLTVVTGASDSLESPGVSITSGTSYTATARLLLGTSTTVTLNMSNAAAWSGGVNPAATFNLSTGAMTGVAANTTAKVEALPGGWFAVSITATAAATTTSSLRVVPVSSSSTTIVWGLQLEAGAFPTSYIPTGAASATRAADVVTCTGSAFSSWFNATEGTFVAEFVCPSVSSTTYQRAFSMRDNAETKRLEAYIDVSGALAAYLVGSAGDLKVLVGSVTPRAIYKAAIAADASTASAVANGGAVSSLAAAGVLSAMQKLTLGNSGDVSMAGALNSSIKRVRYWRKRLTNAQLQALTA